MCDVGNLSLKTAIDEQSTVPSADGLPQTFGYLSRMKEIIKFSSDVYGGLL